MNCLNRRDFVKTVSAVVGGGILASHPLASDAGTSEARWPAYEDNLRDRLWMWGHDPGVYDGPKGIYNIPLSPAMSMAEGIRSMGIPNVCVIRGGTADENYRRQFKDVKRVAWNLSSGSNSSYRALKDSAFRLREMMPNLTGYYLDDFFRFSDKPDFDKNSETKPAPAALSLEELKTLHDEMAAYRRRLDLAMVLYTHELCPAIKPFLPYVDTVSLWIWTGSDIRQIETHFKKYRSLAPDKPTLLGIYMWDFGNKKALSVEFMAKQLDYARQLYKEGQIEGMIFHCTPLCNKELAAVDYARRWIAEHGREGRQAKKTTGLQG